MRAPSACGDDGDSNENGGTDGGGGDATLTLRLGHSYGIDSLQNRAAEQLAENVNEASDGRLTIEVFPASQLGSWEEMQEGLEIGSVDIVIESVGSLERYTDLAAIEGVPFLYRDADHFFAVWDGEIGVSQMIDTAVLDIDSEEDFLLMEVIANHLFSRYEGFAAVRDNIRE